MLVSYLLFIDSIFKVVFLLALSAAVFSLSNLNIAGK